jgi:redox-sensing transcriptional repressor
MEPRPRVPNPALNRLPLYYRYLLDAQEQRIGVVSSEMLGDAAGVPAAQVRKDLAYLGEFGRPGVGYDVGDMRSKLAGQLGLDVERDVVVIGAGRLGSAISAYRGFSAYGLTIAGIFDNSARMIGTKVGDLEVQDIDKLPSFMQKRPIQIAILTVPASDAQKVAERLVSWGINAIMNFAPVKLELPPNVELSNEDLAARLATLCFRLSNRG